MYLTAEEKNMFFQKYDLLIWNTVHRFKRRCTAHINNEEDLYQECAVVLAGHINSAQDEEQLHRIPVLDMLNAMTRFVLAQQAVRLPVRTTDFKSSISGVHHNVEFSSVENKLINDPVDEMILSVDFDHFCSQLPPSQENVVSLKRSNHSNREIARALGMDDYTVTRTLNRIRRSFHTFQSK